MNIVHKIKDNTSEDFQDREITPAVNNSTTPAITASAENKTEGEASATTPAACAHNDEGGEIATAKHQSGLWQQYAKIEPAKFLHKSLAAFHMNPVVGCFHGCCFCYVPSVSVNKQASKLKPLGVEDPDADWGKYGFVRIWDEKEFRKSLKKAEATPVAARSPRCHALHDDRSLSSHKECGPGKIQETHG